MPMSQRSVQQNEITRPGADPDVIDAVDRTLAILECFSSERPDLGISEISRELGMHKSAIFRSLATLEARGLVEKNPSTRRYSVGPKILRPAGAYLSAVGLHERARPCMEQLMVATRETVSLYVPAGDRCVCIDRVESPLELRRVIRVGQHHLARGPGMQRHLVPHPDHSPDLQRALHPVYADATVPGGHVEAHRLPGCHHQLLHAGAGPLVEPHRAQVGAGGAEDLGAHAVAAGAGVLLHQPPGLQGCQRPEDGALVHPQLPAYLADAQVRPLAGEALQDSQGPVHGVNHVGIRPRARYFVLLYGTLAHGHILVQLKPIGNGHFKVLPGGLPWCMLAGPNLAARSPVPCPAFSHPAITNP